LTEIKSPPRTVKKRYIFLRSISMLVLLGLAVHLILPQVTSLEHSVNVIKNMKWWAVGLALLAQVLSYVGTGYLLRATARAGGGEMKIIPGAAIAIAGADFGMLTGGMVATAAVTYRWMHSRGIPKEGALLSGILPSLLNNGLLLIISVLGLLQLLITDNLTTLQAIIFIFSSLLLSGAIFVIFWSMKHRDWLVNRVTGLRKRWAKFRHKEFIPTGNDGLMEKIFDAWDTLHANGWEQPIAGAIMTIGFDILTLFFLFYATGNPVDLGILLTGYGLPLILGKMTFLPGGVGIVEGTMATLYNGLSVPPGVSVVVIIAYRTISFWIPTIIGVPLMAWFQRHSNDS